MLAMYLKYHKAGFTPTTPVTSIAISPVKMSIGRKSLTNLRSEMIFLQGKPVFYIFRVNCTTGTGYGSGKSVFILTHTNQFHYYSSFHDAFLQ
jgi:hypothetical protein